MDVDVVLVEVIVDVDVELVEVPVVLEYCCRRCVNNGTNNARISIVQNIDARKDKMICGYTVPLNAESTIKGLMR